MWIAWNIVINDANTCMLLLFIDKILWSGNRCPKAIWCLIQVPVSVERKILWISAVAATVTETFLARVIRCVRILAELGAGRMALDIFGPTNFVSTSFHKTLPAPTRHVGRGSLSDDAAVLLGAIHTLTSVHLFQVNNQQNGHHKEYLNKRNLKLFTKCSYFNR